MTNAFLLVLPPTRPPQFSTLPSPLRSDPRMAPPSVAQFTMILLFSPAIPPTRLSPRKVTLEAGAVDDSVVLADNASEPVTGRGEVSLNGDVLHHTVVDANHSECAGLLVDVSLRHRIGRRDPHHPASVAVKLSRETAPCDELLAREINVARQHVTGVGGELARTVDRRGRSRSSGRPWRSPTGRPPCRIPYFRHRRHRSPW